MRVTNGIPLGCPPPLTGTTINSVQTLKVEHAGTTRQVQCGAVVMASGIDLPNVPDNVDGIDLAEGYEDLPSTGEGFEGQTVAIFGYGNSAHETADIISPYVVVAALLG
jgi:cation diffusion facilitator CzcD-associated flavoprotein CzcO